MKLLDKRKGVRIIIGEYKQGETGIKPPTKTITLIDTTVKKVYILLIKLFRKKDD